MARPSPSCAHDDDRLHFSPASPPSSNSSEKKESTGPRLSQLCPPSATPSPPPLRQLSPPAAAPSPGSSHDYRRSDAHIVENGFAERSVVNKSAKVVLEPISKSPEEDNEASELYEAEEVVGVVFPTDEDAAL